MWFRRTMVDNQHINVCVCMHRQTPTKVLRTPCLLSRQEAEGIQIFKVEGHGIITVLLHFWSCLSHPDNDTLLHSQVIPNSEPEAMEKQRLSQLVTFCWEFKYAMQFFKWHFWWNAFKTLLHFFNETKKNQQRTFRLHILKALQLLGQLHL